MQTEILSNIITAVNGCQEGGFSYVETFLSGVCDYRQELNIGVGVAVWTITYQKKEYHYRYFMNTNKVNLDSFRLEEMMLHNGLIDSKYESINSFKNSQEFGLAHTVAFPIHYDKGSEKLFDVRGIVILISADEIKLTHEELQLLYVLLESQSPSTIDNPQVSKAINKLVSDNVPIMNLSLKDRHRTLNKALEILACKGGKERDDHGLKHFSFWSVDNVNRIYASKEFNKNTTGNKAHDKTVDYVEYGTHYIYSYAEMLRNEPKETEIEKLIRVFAFSEIAGSIRDRAYFDEIGIDENGGVVILAPIRFESYSSICCFYVKDIIYSPFVSITLLQELVDAIKQRIILVNEINIKNILSRMMATKSITKDAVKYYGDVQEILKEGNEADECLIYLRNNQHTRYMLVSVEDEENPSTVRQVNVKAGDVAFYLPMPYSNDKGFVDYLKQILTEGQSDFLYEQEIYVAVNTSCLTRILDNNGEFWGFVLLFNKKHITESLGTYFHNTFYYNNVYILRACNQYMVQYRSLEFANSRRNELLKKYRHEMPNCTQVIDKNIRIIKEQYKQPAFRINQLERYANELIVNCNRIDMLASFFSAVDYDDERLLGNPLPFNMEEYLRYQMDAFREEGIYRGVCLISDIDMDTPTQNVSIFYQLSVTNLIINAIRYAAPGTCILIRSNSEVIEVIDLGIPVEDAEKERIFHDGYRGLEARRVDQNGKGYGLYLTKRIIEAHGQSIEVSSEFVSDSNYFAETALRNALSKMPKTIAEKFIYEGLIGGEETQATQLYMRMQNSYQMIDADHKKYINNDQAGLERWIAYNLKNNHVLLDMEEDVFSRPVYKVSFIVHL